MSTTIIHGSLPEGIRDHHGVFSDGKNEDPAAKLATAGSRVAELKRKHTEAQSTLRLAVEDDGGTYDFQALKGNVHRLARALEVAQAATSARESGLPRAG